MSQTSAILSTTANAGRIVQALTLVCGEASTSGDNTLVAAPGSGVRLVVKDFLVQNESSVDTTAILRSEGTDQWRARLSENGSLGLSFETGSEWRLAENEALVLELSGANSHGYTIRYFTEVI